MTSYDDDADQSDLNPAYGLHLHNPQLLEYVVAPDTAEHQTTGCITWAGIGLSQLTFSCSLMRD